MLHTTRTRILSFFILVLMMPFSIPSVQSNPDEGLYSHISEITISSPVCNSRYNLTYFNLDLLIELYSTLNDPFVISTPDSILFIPKVNVSFVDETNTVIFLYDWESTPANYLIPPNTSYYARQYTFAFHFDSVCFLRLPEGNYTVWLELASISPIPYHPFSSFIYVNETNIVISHEPYNNTFFTIPEYFQSFTYFGILQVSLILIVLLFYKRRKNYSKHDYKL